MTELEEFNEAVDLIINRYRLAGLTQDLIVPIRDEAGAPTGADLLLQLTPQHDRAPGLYIRTGHPDPDQVGTDLHDPSDYTPASSTLALDMEAQAPISRAVVEMQELALQCLESLRAKESPRG